MAAKEQVISNPETGAEIQVEMANPLKEEKQPEKAGETAVTGAAPKKDESALAKAWDFLMRYTLMNLFENLMQTQGSYEDMEKFFAMMVLMNALVFAMSSAMASSLSFEELEYWYNECHANAGLRECIGKYGFERNGADVCSLPIRKFQVNITISHQMLAFSLFTSALMYLYTMAFMKKGDESEELKAKEQLSDEQLAARNKKRQTWTLLSVIAISAVFITVAAIVFYQLAYNYMTTFKFMVFAWRKGNCDSGNVRHLSATMGIWLVAVGLVVICSIASLILGVIHGRPQKLKLM